MFVQRQDLLSTVQVPDLHRTICQGEGGREGGREGERGREGGREGGEGGREGGRGGGGRERERERESLEELFAGGQNEAVRLPKCIER